MNQRNCSIRLRWNQNSGRGDLSGVTDFAIPATTIDPKVSTYLWHQVCVAVIPIALSIFHARLVSELVFMAAKLALAIIVVVVEAAKIRGVELVFGVVPCHLPLTAHEATLA